MNFKKMIYSVSPKLLSRIISLILALLIALLTFRICYTAGDNTDAQSSDAQKDEEKIDNGKNDVGANAGGGTFLRDKTQKIGTVVASGGAAVCGLTDNLLIAEKLADTPVVSSGEAVVFAVALMTVKAANEGKILLSDEAVCPASAAKSSGYSASAHILPIGRRMQIVDILKCMLFQSGSSFAYTLAVHISGSIDAFTKEMNGYLASIGLTCIFSDCTGDVSSSLSPYELAVIVKHFYNEPTLKEIIKSSTPISISVGQSVDLVVKNDFFTNYCTHHQAKNDGIIGGKICKNGVGAVLFEKNGKEYLVIVMNSTEPFADILMLFSAYVLS